MKVRGKTSFEHLRTVNGIILATYQCAYNELKLLQGDEHWENTLSGQTISELPPTL